MELEYIDTVFTTIKSSSFAQYSLTGIKVLAVLLFLINLLKKYNEGAAEVNGTTWGLSPSDLIKNLMVVLLVIFSSQILSGFDSILVAIENQYRATAPALLPLQFQDLPVEQNVGPLQAAQKALALLYEALVTPFFSLKMLAFLLGIFLWLLDLFIYPLFLAERFFLLGILQAFFPLIISLSVYEKFRGMAYNFFKLYGGVYMMVPAFFLVNVFVNALYTEINSNFWTNLLGSDYGESAFAPIVELGSVGFIVFLKFKLYKKAISFTLRLFTG
jgi:preprotein translocase subunit SecE